MSPEERAKDRKGFVPPRPGDRASFDTLMREHGDFLRATIETEIDVRLHAVLDTADVIEDVSIAAYRAIEHTDLPTAASFQRWLELLIRERLTDLTERHLGTHGTGDAHSQVHPSVIATRRDAAEALERVLARIPAREREMIRLIQIERLPLREITSRTGKKRAAVRRSIARALDACGEALAAEAREA